MCLFENTAVFVKLLQLLLKSQNPRIIQKTTAILPTVFCILSSPYTKLLEWNKEQKNLDVHIICEECALQKLEISSQNKWVKLGAILKSVDDERFTAFDIYQRVSNNEALTSALFERYKLLFNIEDVGVKVNLALCFVSVSKHLKVSCLSTFTNVWLLAGDKDVTVKNAVAGVVGTILKQVQVRPVAITI